MPDSVLTLAAVSALVLLACGMQKTADGSERGFLMTGIGAALRMFVTVNTGHTGGTIFCIVLLAYSVAGLARWSRDPVRRRYPLCLRWRR